MLLLDTTDKRILASLSKKAAHPSEIARALLLPRTTISFRLVRLLTFKRVTSEKDGRKTMWRIARERIHNKALYALFEGENFLECYKIIETLPAETSVYVVQGKGAADVIFKRVPEELIQDIHRTIKRKRIIMRGITNKDITDVISSLSSALKKSHAGRIQSIKLIDNKFLSSGELFIAPTYIALVNPSNRKGIIVKDLDVVKLLYDFAVLFFTLSDNLESFDLNRFIKKSIESG